MVLEWLRNRGGGEAHDDGQPILLLQPIQILQFLVLPLLLEVKLLHDARVGMVSPAVVALIEHHEGIIRDLDVAPPQAVQEHLGDHHRYGGFLHLVQEGLAGGHVALDTFSFGYGLVLVLFAVDADHLAVEVLHLPVQLDVLIAQPLSEVPREGLVVDDRLEGDLDGLGLLLDQLYGVGQEDNLLAGAELAEIVVHGADGDPGLACAGGQVDDAVPVPGVLDEGGLEAAKSNAVFLGVCLVLFPVLDLFLVLDLLLFCHRHADVLLLIEV